MNKEKITLICVEDRYPDIARNLLEHQKKITGLTKSILFGAFDSDIKIEKINSSFDYSNFIIKKLSKYVTTEYVLIVQLDGYILNPDAWSNDYYAYDYIGAPWASWMVGGREDLCVGNGGFSFRSKKLLDLCERSSYNISDPPEEDVYICRTNKDYFVSNGCKFAPINLAAKFSVENNLYANQFGFHGKNTYDMNKGFGILI